MREDLLDLWTAPAQARCITTNGSVKGNGRAVMGRGVAKQATDRYAFMQLTLGKAILLYGNHVVVLFEPPAGPEDWTLVSFPVKYEWDQKANLDLIFRSAKELVTLTDQKGWTAVVLPRPGCGNGHRRWSEVRPILQPLLDDRFTVVTL
jgi:hypothetical protein